MKAHTALTTAVLVAATLVAMPASAQNRRERDNHDRSSANLSEQRRDRAVPRAVPRSDNRVIVRPQVVRPQVVRPYDRGRYYGRPYYSRPYAVRPYYARPYVFRPRTTLRFGVILGYPVPYAYAYPYPVPVYGYGAPSAPVVVGPNVASYGGVSLEFSPSDANVYVDGNFAGYVSDFDGQEGTLTLTVGRHTVEISAPGYEPVRLDVDVYGGQIVPYQGSLRPLGY